MTFRVKDGLSVNGALFVDTSTNVRAVSAVITGTSGATSAVTGSLQVAGGVGVAGGVFVGGTVTATTFVGAFSGAISGTATSANNLTNGTAGQVPYQTGAGATSFFGPGTSGQLLVSAGTSAPVYTSTGSIYVGNAAVANVLNAGNTSTQLVGFAATAGALLAANTTTQQVGFADTAGKLLAGNTGTQYVGFANKSNNIIGGTAGQLHYQTGADATSFVGPGTAGQILVSAGTSAPVYTNTGSIYVNRATLADTATSANALANALTAGTGLTSNNGTYNGNAAVTFTLNTATYMANAVTANNIAAGTAGQLVYQTGAGVTSFAGPGTAGQLLMSAGTSAPAYTNTASIYVNSAVSSEKLKGGGTGSIVYQSAADTTAFLTLSGTAKSLLTAGVSAPTYVTQVQAQSGTGSATAATGQSLVVTGGGLGVTGDSYFANSVGIAGGLTVGGTVTFSNNVVFNGTATTIASTNTVYTDNIINLHIPPTGVTTPWFVDDLKDVGFVFHYYKNSTDTNAALVLANDTKYLEWYSAGAEGTTGTIWNGTYGTFKTGSIIAADTTGATSAVTGALKVSGGVGVAGGVYVGGVVTATTFVGALTGTATSANNLTGGTAGQIHYQTGPGATSFAGPGTAGQILVSAGTSAPTYTNTASIYVNSAVYAEELRGGTVGQLVYQSAPSTTDYVGPGTAGQILVSAGAAVPVYTNTSSIYVNRAVIADSSTGQAGSVANALTISTGLTGSVGTYNGSAAVTVSLNTATLMATAVTALTVPAANISGTISNSQLTGSGALTVTAGTGLTGGGSVALGGSTTLTLNTATYMASAATASKVANAHTAGTGLTGTAFDGSAAQTWTLNTATLMQTAVTALSASGSAGSTVAALTAGTGLTSSNGTFNGSSAVTFSLNTATYMASAVTANNITGGTTGQVPYQSGAGATSFYGPGTAGQILVSAGAAAPTYTNTASIYVNSAVNAQTLFGGTTGQLHYQSGAGVTAFAGPGTAGQLLMSAGASAPVYTNTASIYVNRAVTADNLVGGSSISGNLTVTGNLVVQGVTTTVDSTVTNIADPIITIGGGAGGAAPTGNDSKDRGIAFQWHNGTAAKLGFFGYKNSTGYMTFVPDATITGEVVTGTKGTLDVNLANALTIGTGLSGTSYNGGSAVTIANTGVTSNVAGTGISVSAATGAVTITNSGVTSIVAGTAISVSGATGAVTVNNTGVTSAAVSGTGLSINASTGGITITSNATNLNTVSTIVARDASGNFSAGTITAALTGNVTGNVTGTSGSTTGNAATATALQTARLIQGVSFNGSADITVVTAGTGIGVSGTTVTNNGVTSNVAGTGVSVSAATGAVTISIGQAVATSSNVQFNSLGVGTAGSATAGEIRATNEITAYYSDRRLKENVKVIDNAVEKVLSLHGITYTPNEVAESFGYDRTVKLVGLFADEVEAVLPEATRPAPFDQDENGNSKSGENYKTIQYEKLVPLLIEAIKEQQKQIAQLSETINTLVNK